MWACAGPGTRHVITFNYPIERQQDVPLRILVQLHGLKGGGENGRERNWEISWYRVWMKKVITATNTKLRNGETDINTRSLIILVHHVDWSCRIPYCTSIKTFSRPSLKETYPESLTHSCYAIGFWAIGRPLISKRGLKYSPFSCHLSS